ncbi:hypothetical protein GCM10023115_39890 [Pontixanthobacter gangjinensis]|uniref:HYR domain-containing protein n=1 Tax=Christiangramia aestuarii TaxID=1028746 RepID=A0A7K1LS37_9FLAO|nr:HYR domain-containing protein [Christiangramia aestuarii]MUP43624.1 HYR domain-containing protein [Christiangramia aestuarii]
MISAADIPVFKGASTKRACTFILFLLGFIPAVFGQDPADIVPSYIWQDKVDLPTVSATDLNVEDITISIATDSKGNVYTLSFGNGVQKRDSDGNLISTIIPANQLDNPVDLAVDNNDIIYVADYLAQGSCSDNGKIKAFDQNGQLLSSKIQLTSFYRPIGIEFDSDNNLYVAEYNQANSGCENDELSRLRVYKTDGSILTNDTDISQPYRVAVDSQKRVFVSQGDGRLLMLDSNLNLIKSISNLQSPASIAVDSFDYLHVLEYADRVDFNDFINYESIDLLAVAREVRDGINNEDFVVKIFDANQVLVKTFVDKIDFPLDITFNQCDRMYVDNSEIFGVNFFGAYIPSRLEFDLEIYERTPAFDITKPEITCPADITVQAQTGNDFAIVNYATATATDACGVSVQRISGLSSGSQFPIGENYVDFEATDGFGNKSSCRLSITVEGEDPEDTPPEFENCPADIPKNNDTGQCAAVVTFATPVVTDDSGSITPTRTDGSGLNSGDEFPVGITTIIYEADDGVNGPVTCSFDIIVSDNEDPVFTSCLTENPSFTIQEGENHILNDYASQVTVTDNCSNGLNPVQTPAPGTPINEDQVVTITVTDEAGNISEPCSFTVEIIQEAAPEPTFDCPVESELEPLYYGENCSVSVPEYEILNPQNFDAEPYLVQTYSENENSVSVTLQVYDGEGGELVDVCSFNVDLIDDLSPTISNCPTDNLSFTIQEGENHILNDYTSQVTVADNCSTGLIPVQTPAPGTPINEDQVVTITVTDEAGNISEPCSFTVEIIQEATPEPTFDCPAEDSFQPITKGANCEYEIPDYRDQITNPQNFTEFRVLQNYIKGDDLLQVSLEVYDGDELMGICEFDVPLVDETAPQFTDCVNRNIEIEIPEGGNWTMEDFRDDFELTDNCDQDLAITQDPEPGTPITETTDVRVRATDDSGRSATCLFTVNIVEVAQGEIILNCPGEYEIYPNENCEYIVPPFSEILDFSPADAEISQSIEAGSVLDLNSDLYINITASFNGQTENCAINLIPVSELEITCPGDIMLSLAGSEQISLPDYRDELIVDATCSQVEIVQVPAPGTPVSDDLEISFEVNDDLGNSTRCSFQLDIVREDELMINCPGNKEFEYDANCSFILPDFTDEAEVNNGEGLVVSQQPAPGTIISVAETEVSLFVENENGRKSCSFFVYLEDNTPPELRLKDISLQLNTEGMASISLGNIDNGSFDNCDAEIIYTLSRTEFSCKNVGENQVQVTAEDTNGNVSTATATVTIIAAEGICEEIVEEFEYIFVYPNPNTGNFKISVPTGEKIERVEVFDHRGRFITAKDFEPTDLEYAMQIGYLQEAVYVLKIVTNERTVAKRIIYKY